ncbi:MAG TPA: hypothetical protein P5311_00330 [Candidatus Dojkabacteria bacterium]|nr:hypothetical protein [Candidatus Dojkabacteria bacterium]
MKSATRKLPNLSILLLQTILTVIFPISTFAYEVGSTNYKLTGVTTSGLGGIFESANYNLLSNTGQISADPRNYSTSYRINQGPSEAFRAAQVNIQCFETDTDGTTDCTSGPTELLSGGMVALCGGTGCYDRARFEIEPYTNPDDALYTIQISTDNFSSDIKCINASTFYPQELSSCDINDFRSETFWEDEDFNILGLQADTTYYIRVSALHGDFTQSEYSQISSTTTSTPYLFFDIDIATQQGGMTTVPVTEGRVLHFDATTITGASDNDPITTWEDISDTGNDASQGTSSRRPIYKESAFNNLPALEFDPSNLTSLTASSPASMGNQYTAFAAVYPYTQTGTGDFSTYGFTIMATTTRYALWFLLRQGEIKHYAYSGSTGTYGLTSGANAPNNSGSIVTADATINTTDGANIYLDSSLEVTHTPANNPWEGAFCIGDLRNGRNIGFDGLIGEVIIYNTTLSTEERSLVEQYLGEKWLGWSPTSGNYAESSPPYSVSFSGDGRLIAGAGAVTAPTLIWMDLDSSSMGGSAIIQRGEYGGLYSPTTTETITSSNLDLDGVLAEGFGLQNYFINYESSTYLGTITTTTNYSGSGNVVGEVLTDARKIYEANGPINNGRMGLYLKARASESRTPGTDYSEFITFVSVPRY